MMHGYRIVDLSLPILDGGGFLSPARITYLDHTRRGRLVADRTGLSPEALGGRANAMEEFEFLTTHTGTHMDAPWHYGATAGDGPASTIDQIPLEWCLGDGVWLDLRGMQPGDRIGEADLVTALRRVGYTLKPKDIVLLCTGTAAHYGEPGCDGMNPGVTAEATTWLGEQGIRVVGIDAGIWDRPVQLQLADLKAGHGEGRYMEGHRAAGEYGMCILEWLTNLESLPHTGFLVCAFPVKIHRAGGAWVRAVALLKDAEASA
jgi:kynurenine formamidase